MLMTIQLMTFSLLQSIEKKSRESSPRKEAQKRVKGKGKANDMPPSLHILDSAFPNLGESSKFNEPQRFISSTAVSVSSSLDKNETKKQVITVKATVKSIWNPMHMQALFELVDATNIVVTHTFAFSKYIFLQELKENFKFELDKYIRKDFFVKVFLSLIDRKTIPGRLQNRKANYRTLISEHKESYCKSAKYTPIGLPYAQQRALYECTKIQTAYVNNIKVHFGNRLRGILNKLFKKKKEVG
ncbi:uncharacterized protein BX663DRAFT_71047 [Cokeromyces recurvatus]|uniref:uncharacterized protein n=1 Tax=Cokeromyces recurvatus TaxID=90255 RepID=UPI002220C59F|nr:uncharacterized protein BX663DRAFT_71047 [Cokeromyces recurvatus]KAI7902284.1 hypothetical protein BX663DRAFT_71047 [Cokeromyces recurvatus]